MRKQTLLIFLAILATATCAFSQQLTLSPYSRYGLGEVFSANSTRNFAMGGIGIGTYGWATVNRVNPASYADIRLTTLDISGYGEYRNLRSSVDKAEYISGGFHNFSFAFRTNKKLTFTMGLAPYSSLGYDIRVPDSLLVDSTYENYTTSYTADGGLNQLYIGVGFTMFKKLRVGANLPFNFGTFNYRWNTSFENSQILPVNALKQVALTGFLPRIGLQYEDSIRVPRKIDQYAEMGQRLNQIEGERKEIEKERKVLAGQEKALNTLDEKFTDRKAELQRQRNKLNNDLAFLKAQGVVSEKEVEEVENKDRKLAQQQKRMDVKVRTKRKDLKKRKANLDRQEKRLNEEVKRLEAKRVEVKDSDLRYRLDTARVLFRVGGIFDPPGTISGDRLLTYTNGIPSFVDTLGVAEEGKVRLPMRYGLGLSLGKPGVWQAGVDFMYEDWKSFEFFSETNTLRNSWQVNVGGEWTPDRFSTKLYKKIAWRAGGFFNSSALRFDDTPINEYGISVGMGLPLGRPERYSNVYSRINIGLMAGQRGTTANNLLGENFIRLRLGVNLNDRWFKKRRVN